MKDENINWGLFFVLLFAGWLGLDKFYIGGKPAWKLFGLKLLAMTIGLGELWNVFDIIMCLFKRYELDPRDYLGQLEERHKFD
jgi:hypothetical protein